MRKGTAQSAQFILVNYADQAVHFSFPHENERVRYPIRSLQGYGFKELNSDPLSTQLFPRP